MGKREVCWNNIEHNKIILKEYLFDNFACLETFKSINTLSFTDGRYVFYFANSENSQGVLYEEIISYFSNVVFYIKDVNTNKIIFSHGLSTYSCVDTIISFVENKINVDFNYKEESKKEKENYWNNKKSSWEIKRQIRKRIIEKHKHVGIYHSIKFKTLWSSIKKLSKMKTIEFDFDDIVLTENEKRILNKRATYENLCNYYEDKESHKIDLKRLKKKYNKKGDV